MYQIQPEVMNTAVREHLREAERLHAVTRVLRARKATRTTKPMAQFREVLALGWIILHSA
jgi:hypothetical protein